MRKRFVDDEQVVEVVLETRFDPSTTPAYSRDLDAVMADIVPALHERGWQLAGYPEPILWRATLVYDIEGAPVVPVVAATGEQPAAAVCEAALQACDPAAEVDFLAQVNQARTAAGRPSLRRLVSNRAGDDES